MREDPLHFKETLLEWGDHRLEQVRATDGTRYPDLETTPWYDQVLVAMIMDAYTSFHCWDLISRQVEKVLKLKNKAGQLDDQDASKLENYEFAVAYLEFVVVQAMTRPLMKWRDGLAGSPPLRKHFSINLDTARVHPKVDCDKEKDKFLWLLQMPLHDGKVDQFGTWKLMDSLNWIMRTEPQNKHRITQWVATLISDMSLLAELSRQAHLLNNRPLMAYKQNEHTKEKKVQLDKDTEDIEKVYCVFRQKDIKLVQHVMPFDKLNYPCHRRRTAATTKSMQKAEKALDSFWEHLDSEFVRFQRKTLHQFFAGAIEERDLVRTPDWSEEYSTRPPSRDTRSHNTAAEDVRESLRDLELRSERTIGQDTAQTPKQKPKTRGTPSESLQPADAGIPHQPDPTPPVPKILVSKRALAVFSTLFFTGFHGDNPGEIAWSEFLHAMASAGFMNKKLDGSAWIFAPMDDNFRRSIIFHEPHPVSKIPFRNARRMGRRLERNFGWTGVTFERA